MVVTAVVASVAATTYTAVVAKNAADEQKRAQNRALAEQQKANQQAAEQAQAEADRADVAYNQANQQQPEVQAIVSRSEQAATQGPSSTVLTGGSGGSDAMVNPAAQAVASGRKKSGKGGRDQGGGSLLTGTVGVDPPALNLGGNTLLGG